MESAEAAIGWAGNMQLSTLDLIVPQNLVQELGEDAVAPSFEEQVIAGRNRACCLDE